MPIRTALPRVAVTLAGAAAASVVVAVVWRLGLAQVVVSLIGLVCVAIELVGVAFVRADRRNRAGWVFVVAGLCVPVGNLLSALAQAAFHHGLHLPGRTAVGLTALVVTIFGIFLLGSLGVLWFPDGARGSRRRRLIELICVVDLVGLCGWVLFSTPVVADATVVNPLARPAWVAAVGNGFAISIVLYTPITVLTALALRRKARRATGETGRALRLAAWCAAAVPGSFLLCIAVSIAGLNNDWVSALEDLGGLSIAVGAWVGIVRYGLLDVRAVANRALVYAALTSVIVAVYLLVAVGLGGLAGGSLWRVVGAGAAALATLPLRERVQRQANRLVYGLRDEPVVALSRLGARLDAAGAPQDVLPAVVGTVADALRLQYVAVVSAGEVIAHAGRSLDLTRRRQIELAFGGESVGELVLESRPGARTPQSGSAVASLVPQIAVALRTVQLTSALTQSRETLVLAREEERRHLRRELHDGLGPTLAAIALGIESAQRSAVRPVEQARTGALLALLHDQTSQALRDVRRIAYDLRPPILDELGLVAALREQADRFGVDHRQLPDQLAPLPAAVEVAAYRIAVEAIANCVRHASGARISLTLAVNGRVELCVSDDGPGLPENYVAGVGITSMRERAAELGGACIVERILPHGTAVSTRLPLVTSDRR